MEQYSKQHLLHFRLNDKAHPADNNLKEKS